MRKEEKRILINSCNALNFIFELPSLTDAGRSIDSWEKSVRAKASVATQSIRTLSSVANSRISFTLVYVSARATVQVKSEAGTD